MNQPYSSALLENAVNEFAKLPGIGRKTAQDICAKSGVDCNRRVQDLSEEEVAKVREVIDSS